ncbi:hypothetical protein BC833DRAFT_624826 [Globomyces pollinis-pini]|nr:hypothetical protein BC833DRAFT_624826 [Globomyces pollinis-pini]
MTSSVHLDLISTACEWEYSKDKYAVEAFEKTWERSKKDDSDQFYDLATSFVRPAAGGAINALAAFMNPRLQHPNPSMDFPTQELIDKIISIKCYSETQSLKLESQQQSGSYPLYSFWFTTTAVMYLSIL